MVLPIKRATQMTTRKQIEANRLNAKRSTGPTTEAGRAISRRNAFKHGLTAQEVTLDEEEARSFEAFRDDILQDLAPEGALEEELAQRVVMCFWRLRRIPRLEAAMGAPIPYALSDATPPAYEFIRQGTGQLIVRYEVALERMRQRALHELERLQARRRGEAVVAPIAVDVTHSIAVGPQDVAQPHSNGNPSVAKRLPAPI
jgi:hypothetical protein